VGRNENRGLKIEDRKKGGKRDPDVMRLALCYFSSALIGVGLWLITLRAMRGARSTED